MTTKHLYPLLFVLLTVCLLPGCAGLSLRGFERAEMLDHLTESIIVPAHQTLADRAAELAQVAQAFRADPSAETLAATRSAWLETAIAWEQCSLFGFSEVIIVHNQIGKWPVNESFIDEFIADPANETLDAAFIESIGSTAKGLFAMEYLLFDAAGNDTVLLRRFAEADLGPRRADYLAALAENLQAKTAELLAIWTGEGENLAQRFRSADFDGGELNGSVSMLTNEMVALLESMVQTKIGRPLGKDRNRTVVSRSAQAWRSLSSNQLLAANLNILYLTYSGGGSAKAQLGFDDYLTFIGMPDNDPPLTERIETQFTAAHNALVAINQPLSIAVETQPEQVSKAYDELRALLVLFKVDLANQLGVTITFNDNDGD
jgi:predicted lipoprotein